MTGHVTVLPLMLVLLIGLARMGTDIYQICAWNVGILKVEPWRRRRAAVADTARRVIRRLAYWGRWLGGWPAVSAAAVVALMVLLPEHREALAGGLLVGRIDSLRVARAEAHKEFDAAVKAVSEAKTPEEKAAARERASAAKAKFDDLGEDLRLEETRLEQERQLGDAIAAGRAPKDPNQAAADAARASAGLQVGKDHAEDDPKRGFKNHREFMQCVMEAGRGRRIDARLKPLAAAGSDEQGEYSDPHGGYLVPHGIAPGILSIGADADPLGGLTRSVTMTAPTVSFNARVDKDHTSSVSGGLVVTRRPETVDGTASRMKFEQVTLTANEEFGLAFASERILSDSPISFVELISAGFGDEFIANRMRERASGTGAGERQGWLNAGCKVAVAKETGQAAATIVKANVDNMAARCWRYSQAVWIANHSTRPQLKSLVQVVGTGGNSVPYFVSSPSGQETLDGRPILFSEFAETLGAEGDLVLLVPSEYLEGTYRGMDTAESIHVRFAAAERAFRFYQRNDGQWWWRSALTPKKGTTLSPVVTLAVRS